MLLVTRQYLPVRNSNHIAFLCSICTFVRTVKAGKVFQSKTLHVVINKFIKVEFIKSLHEETEVLQSSDFSLVRAMHH